MTAQPYVTAEHPSLDSPLESPLSAAAWRPIPERSAHEWIDRTARNLLPRPGTVVALDHGTGHWITSLMPLGHEVLAADSSQERLNTLAQRAGYALSHEPRFASLLRAPAVRRPFSFMLSSMRCVTGFSPQG